MHYSLCFLKPFPTLSLHYQEEDSYDSYYLQEGTGGNSLSDQSCKWNTNSPHGFLIPFNARCSGSAFWTNRRWNSAQSGYSDTEDALQPYIHLLTIRPQHSSQHKPDTPSDQGTQWRTTSTGITHSNSISICSRRTQSHYPVLSKLLMRYLASLVTCHPASKQIAKWMNQDRETMTQMSNRQCLANHDKKKIEKSKELIKNIYDSQNSAKNLATLTWIFDYRREEINSNLKKSFKKNPVLGHDIGTTR